VKPHHYTDYLALLDTFLKEELVRKSEKIYIIWIWNKKKKSL